jgi:short-subunit dehydrogenase
VLPLMLARGRGQIAVMSSVAGIASLRDAPAYSASKSALLSYGLALRERLHGTGVRVSVLCPGYVTSPMSLQIRGWKPLEITADRAAERIVKGLARDRAVIAFPAPLVLAARLARLLPTGLRRWAMWPFQSHVVPRSAAPAAPEGGGIGRVAARVERGDDH